MVGGISGEFSQTRLEKCLLISQSAFEAFPTASEYCVDTFRSLDTITLRLILFSNF